MSPHFSFYVDKRRIVTPEAAIIRPGVISKHLLTAALNRMSAGDDSDDDDDGDEGGVFFP